MASKTPAEWEAHMRATREGFTREALRPLDLEPDEETVRALGALLDFPLQVLPAPRRFEGSGPRDRERHGAVLDRRETRWSVKLLFILSPPGFEECVYATSEPAKVRTLPPLPEGPPSEEEMEQLGAIVRQYGCEVLG